MMLEFGTRHITYYTVAHLFSRAARKQVVNKNNRLEKSRRQDANNISSIGKIKHRSGVRRSVCLSVCPVLCILVRDWHLFACPTAACGVYSN